MTENTEMEYGTNCSKRDSITNTLNQCLSQFSTEMTIIEVENESLRSPIKNIIFLENILSLKTHVIFAFYFIIHLCFFNMKLTPVSKSYASERCTRFIMGLHLYHYPSAIYLGMNKTQEILYPLIVQFTHRYHMAKENQNVI